MSKTTNILETSTKDLLKFQMIDTRSATWKKYTNILKQYNCDNPEYAYVLGYLAGLIDGKRQERAKRKKA